MSEASASDLTYESLDFGHALLSLDPPHELGIEIVKAVDTARQVDAEVGHDADDDTSIHSLMDEYLARKFPALFKATELLDTLVTDQELLSSNLIAKFNIGVNTVAYACTARRELHPSLQWLRPQAIEPAAERALEMAAREASRDQEKKLLEISFHPLRYVFNRLDYAVHKVTQPHIYQTSAEAFYIGSYAMLFTLTEQIAS